jgi:hypothetical protein
LLAEEFFKGDSRQKKAMDAGKYIDNKGMTHTGLLNWLKHLTSWRSVKTMKRQ